MKMLKVKPLVAAIALSTAATTSYAQEDGEGMEMLEEVVVTGFRQSLATSLNTKREAAGAVDAIYAEDIADFPDQNLAESLQRIPGVAITRDAGEGRQVSVRGLGPQFTRVQINGMEAMSSTGATDSSGGSNRSRSFDFNTFASELFTELAVVKTSSASLDEGSLGATIQLKTARPLDANDNFNLTVNGQLGYNDLSEESDPRVSAVVSGMNDSETFGWLASVSYTKRNALEEGFSTVRWQTSSDWRSEPGNAGDANDIFHPRIPRYGKLTHEQERLGFTGTLQFRPTDSTEIVVDYLSSTFEAGRDEEFLEALIRSEADTTDLLSYTADGNGTMVTGVLNDANIRIENRHDDLETDFSQLTVDATHEFSDSFRIHALVGTSESDFSNPVQTTVIFDNAVTAGYAWDFSSNSELPQVSFGNFDVSNPDNFLYTNIRQRPNFTNNTFDNFSFDAEFDFNDALSLAAGVSYKSYEFETGAERYDTSLSNIDGIGGPIGIDGLYNITTMGSGLGAPSGTTLSWVSPDVSAASDRVGLDSLEVTNPRLQDNRSVGEDDTAMFVQVNWDTEIAGMGFRGNAGVRYVETDQTSSGFISQPGEDPELITVDRTYDDTLPAINTVLSVTEDMLVRASWSKVMTRPSLGNLTPGGSVDGFNNTVSYQNPYLDPFRADSIDLSWEWYFMDDALLSIAYFQKDIESFITRRTDEGVPWSEIGLPDSLLTGTPAEPSENFDVTRAVNGGGGDLNGFEIQYQQPITDNFGVILNYTKVDSEVNYAPDGEEPDYNQLTGMSPKSYNATLYFENETFGARISYAFRDDYLTRYPGRNGNDLEYTASTANVDMSLSYTMNEHLKFTLEGINLTDEFNHQVVDSSARVSVYHHTGTQYYLGAQYKF
ncbi:TonB-dependent receptor [Gilvimarinus sp. SDUM040013]|uniref:TonB-dependent receptor n=1 Tax=Gilvimarinus gilvus TaxID=3058038 RepID=A0ABU4RY23_9GAMM|nr:TonB-dependent receptor [Gilvimarinus sp. SDUM040013]MDO3386224.1 TonB-dependent receptor [Gilvimarinus sp. SDUM040013]MDX6849781.1 TonB-dependent receptor [Gilvimarinus sp. SDUM040013]